MLQRYILAVKYAPNCFYEKFTENENCQEFK